jgi:hypothetical protein
MRVTAARRRERGAVAIIVSITVVAVLIPTSALAVDLGNVYVRTANLQRAADEAARSGAIAIAQQQHAGGSAAQAMDAARAAVADLLCHDPALNPDTDGDGTGDGPWHGVCAGGDAWESDGNPANGEVQFYSHSPMGQNAYSTAQVADGAAPVSGVRVLTPPSRVEYGLASAIPGQSGHSDPQKSATATLRTVLPKFGFLPLFAVPSQVGGFCIRSAPKTIWNTTHPSGACALPAPVTVAARGYLAVPRTSSSETPTVVWNAARGFDTAHVPLPGQTVALAPQVTQSALVRDLSPGLFGSTATFSGTGRLTSTGCPAGTQTVSGGHAGVEEAHLADFVDTSRADALEAAVISGSPATPSQSGWLQPRILRCGRLAVLPALNVPASFPGTGLPGPTYQVTAWRLVWIDNEFRSGDAQKIATGRCLQRGLYWADPYSYNASCKTDLRAITGYVLDPGFLPAVVAGPDATNQVAYVTRADVGIDLPAAVRLIRDASDPPAG